MSEPSALAQFIAEELYTQSQEGDGMHGYVSADGLDAVVIDGSFNLLTLAEKIISHVCQVPSDG